MAAAKQDRSVVKVSENGLFKPKDEFDICITQLSEVIKNNQKGLNAIKDQLIAQRLMAPERQRLIYDTPDDYQASITELYDTISYYEAEINAANEGIATLNKMQANQPVTQGELDHLAKHKQILHFKSVKDYTNIVAPAAAPATS